MNKLDLAAGFSIGVLSSVAANILWGLVGRHITGTLRRTASRLRRQRRQGQDAGLFRVGGQTIPWVVCARGPYERHRIEIQYDSRRWDPPPIVRQRCAEIERAAQQQIKQGKPAPFNGLGYKQEKDTDPTSSQGSSSGSDPPTTSPCWPQTPAWTRQSS